MKKLPDLVKKVLEYNQPDSSKWNEWLENLDLFPVSQSDCINQFVECMLEIKEKNEKVLIAGDYDCDGIMATTIMMDGLTRFGIECGFYIPDRLKEGYGLHESTVQMANQKGYTVILTVDNGVKASNALAFAHTLGMKTIVTDHHTIDEKVNCDILVHPDYMEDCFSTLCGAALAYECVRALNKDTDFHLMCASVASISDVMKVTNQTRAIIQNGLKKLNESKELHFFSLSNDLVMNETTIGYQIAPKLNAVGRLSDLANVNNVVRYFLCDDEKMIQSFSMQIDRLNNRRKEMSASIVADAMLQCHQLQDIYLVCDDSYHEGMIGLASNALCKKFNKPVIVMTSNHHSYKASMRSPEGFHCLEFLSGFARYETLGGHAQAAGFSVHEDNYKDFENYVYSRIQTYEWNGKIKSVLQVQEEEITLSSLKDLDMIRPFGPGFILPVFEIVHPEIKSIYDFKYGMHRKYVLNNGLQCMLFNQSDKDKYKKNNPIASIEGTVSISYYQNRQSASFTIDEIIYE